MTAQRFAERNRSAHVGQAPQTYGPVGARRRHQPAVAGDRGCLHHSGKAEHAGHRGGGGRVQKAGAGLRGGSDPIGGQGQLRGQGRVAVPYPVRFDGHLTGDGLVPLVLGVRPLLERETGQRTGENEQYAQRGEHLVKPPCAAAFNPLLLRFLLDARVQKFAFQHIEVGAVPWIGRPFAGDSQPGTSVQGRGVAVEIRPRRGGDRQFTVCLPTGPVGVQPVPQPRPLVQQRLVSDLHGVRVDGEQPPSDEPVEDRLHLLDDVAAGPVVEQFGGPDAAADIRGAVVNVDQP